MYNKLKYLYPAARDNDFMLQDDSDGNGPRIVHWNTLKLGQQPTIAEIEAAIKNDARFQAVLAKIGEVKTQRIALINADIASCMEHESAIRQLALNGATVAMISAYDVKAMRK